MNPRLTGRLLLTLVIFTGMLIVRLALTSGVIERLILGGGRLVGWGITGGFLQLPEDRAARLGFAVLLLFGLMFALQWVFRDKSESSVEPRGRRLIDPEDLRRDRPSRHYT